MVLSIIIPCYNEGQDIVKKANIAKDYLDTLNISYELILVNDGSKDDTLEKFSLIPFAKALSYEKNKGKGGAVKYGIQAASGDYIVFMDADLSTDLSAFETLLPYLNEYDFIVGSRHAKGSKIPIKQPLKRRFIGKCCRFLVNMIFGFKFKDTQCGFKAIKNSVAKKFAECQLVNGFAFDVEYLHMAKLNGIKVKEIPIIWRDDRGSTVSPLRSSINFFKALFKIKKQKKNYIFKD